MQWIRYQISNCSVNYLANFTRFAASLSERVFASRCKTYFGRWTYFHDLYHLLTSTAFSSSWVYTGWNSTQSPRTVGGTVLTSTLVNWDWGDFADSPIAFSEGRVRMETFDLPPRILPLALRPSSYRGLLVRALDLGWLVANVRHEEAPMTHDGALTRVNGKQRTAVVLSMFKICYIISKSKAVFK